MLDLGYFPDTKVILHNDISENHISLLFRPFVIRGPWISLLGFQDAIKAKRNTRSSAVVPTTPKKHSQGNEDSIKCQELNMHTLD